jgi:pilus assembly protein CpaB
VGRTATLELTPDQSQTLELSHQLGTLSLALRSIVDSQSSTPESVTDGDDKRAAINTVRYGVSTMTAGH